MFTLKFIQFYANGRQLEDCVRCPHYEANKTSDGLYSITAYNDFTSTNGVERWIRPANSSDQPASFDVCYVENEDGKTIGYYAYKK